MYHRNLYSKKKGPPKVKLCWYLFISLKWKGGKVSTNNDDSSDGKFDIFGGPGHAGRKFGTLLLLIFHCQEVCGRIELG